MNQRTRVKVFVAGWMLAWVGITSVSATEDEPYHEDPEVVGDWLVDWGKSLTREAAGNYVLYHFTDRMYIVTSPLQWKPDDPESTFEPVTVPKGFVTDFASVPRPFWTAYPPNGKYGFPAIFHDYLYWTQSVDRETADAIFKAMMDEFKVGKISTTVIHGTVRAAGGFAWNSNAKAKDADECRFLKKFPQNPNTQWKKWRTRDGVFGSDGTCTETFPEG